MGERRKIQQNEQEEPRSLTTRSAIVGFYGGLIWGVIGYLAYLLQFSLYGPAFILKPFIVADWVHTALGQWMGIFVLALVSIGVALVYKFAFARIPYMWCGLLYGAAFWILVFYVLNPLFFDLKPLEFIEETTLVTTFCLFLLYGLFIGYTISFEYHQFNRPHERHEARR